MPETKNRFAVIADRFFYIFNIPFVSREKTFHQTFSRLPPITVFQMSNNGNINHYLCF